MNDCEFNIVFCKFQEDFIKVSRSYKNKWFSSNFAITAEDILQVGLMGVAELNYAEKHTKSYYLNRFINRIKNLFSKETRITLLQTELFDGVDVPDEDMVVYVEGENIVENFEQLKLPITAE